MTTYTHPAIAPRDIVRHPATQRVGEVISFGYRSAKIRWADGSTSRPEMSELIPASFEEEIDYEEALLFRAVGNIVRLADRRLALVLHAEHGELYVLGLYAGADLTDPVWGRDYWIDWVATAPVVTNAKFETAALVVAGKLFKTGASK